MALSQVTSASGSGTATSVAIPVPAGMSNNDLAILSLRIFASGDADSITPASGFTRITGADFHMTSVDVVGDKWQMATYYKLISGDSGTWTFSWTTSAAYDYAIDVIRGAPTAGSPIDTQSSQGTTFSGSLPSATQTWSGLTLGQTNEYVIAFLANDQGYHSSITTAGWNARINNLGFQCSDQLYSASGSIGNISTSANNTCDQTTTLIAIRAVGAPTSSANPTITDTTSANRWQQGDNLSTDNGTWNSAGSPTSFAYQWKRGSTPITGASVSTYTLVAGDVGSQMNVDVSGTGVGGTTTITGGPTGTVTASGSVPSNSILPVIAGTPTVFQTLSVTNGTWTNSPTGYSYQWRLNGSNVSGASVATYQIPFSSLNGGIDCIVTASNASGSTPATAASVGPIKGSVTLPVVGQVLRGQPGSWTGNPTSYAYQWLQGVTPISAASATSYTVGSVDVGHTLAVQVVASNAAGSSSPAVSTPTGTVVGGPTNVSVPLLIGTAQQGQTLSTDNGSWTNGPTSFAYLWNRDAASVSGASLSTYAVGSVDVGHKLSVTVTASNLAGSAAATSAQSASVVSSGTASFGISFASATNVISWSAYSGATSYTTATSNGDRNTATRTTTYGTVGSATSWAPPSVSGQTLWYGVGAVTASATVWSATEASVAWPATAMAVGCTTGDFGNNTSFGPSGGLTEAQDFAQGGIDWIRASIDEFPNAADLRNYYLTSPLQAIVCQAGPYNTGGVVALVGSDQGQAWASAALSKYQTAAVPISQAPVFEILNEPYGPWFWGSNANSQANAEAFGYLIKTTYNTFHNALGANCPKIIAATFGNGAGTGQPVGAIPNWWTWLSTKHSDIASFYDGVVMHPYGGTGDSTISAQGDRNGVTSAHNATGKPVYVTEVGWPTGLSSGVSTATGDSLQWTEAQQATNIGNFLNWAKGTGYVSAVIIYHHYDLASPAFYGIIYGSSNSAGTAFRHKPAFAVVGAA